VANSFENRCKFWKRAFSQFDARSPVVILADPSCNGGREQARYNCEQLQLPFSGMVSSLPVNIPVNLKVSDEQFLEFVRANPDRRLERTATGQIVIMAPTGSEGGSYNAELSADTVFWNRQTQTGKVFDSSSGFRLPNGAIRSPDVGWVEQSRWEALTPEERKGFAPICPDFVIELASESDAVPELQAKMQEYLENGCQLGWLILPQTRTVEIYRPGCPVATQPFSTPLSGEAILPGFRLELPTIFPAS
jgi:Uma2 family endonuclease